MLKLATAASTAYDAFGLRWLSALELPFAEQRRQEQTPDVTVRLGETPAHLAESVGGTPACWEAAPGTALLSVPGVARYLIRRQEIVIEPAGGSRDDIVTFLIGPAATALLQQRGVATLRAAAVEIDGEAVVVLGVSGAGKSALARALVARGHALLADNLAGLVPASGGDMAVLPAFPRVRLWEDLLPGTERGRPVRAGLKKYWCTPEQAATTPRSVRAIVLLQSHNREAVDALPLAASSAFNVVCAHTACKRLVPPLGQRGRHYRIGVALARSTPFFRVRRPDHPFRTTAMTDAVAEVAARVEALANRTASPRPGTLARPSLGAEDDRTAASGSPGDGASRSMWAAPEGRGIVWIVAYPKCGTTWLRAVLTNYLQNREDAASINALVGDWGARDDFDQLMGLDSSDLKAEELLRHLPRYRELLAEAVCALPPADACGGGPGRRFFAKSHEPFQGATGGPRFSPIGAVGAIYLVRNPLDVAVSYAHHMQAPIDQTIRRMNDPAAQDLPAVRSIGKLLPNPLGTWSEHVASWLDQSALPTCVARYEDLLDDPIAGFGRIVRFAGLEWQPARLARAIDQAQFHRLRAQEAEHGYAERRQTAPTFFRAGVAGSWRRALTRAQVQALLAAHRPMMGRLGYLQEAEAFLAEFSE